MNTILVCDDERDIVSAIRIYLNGEGYRVLEAYSGVQALELIKVVIGFALVKKGVWIHNIVAPVAEKEAAEK
mgnify:FL=1